MKFSEIKYFDVANGTGIRTSLFVSGCTHHCKGCFNEVTWNFNYGEQYTEEIEEEIIKSLEPSYVTGLTLLGGEPMELAHQPYMLSLCKKVKEKYKDKTIWCFTGYLFEELLPEGKQSLKITQELLSLIDVLVDGEFHLSEKDLTLKFKGSRNQRTINVPETLKQNKIVLLEL